jgi:hypothetical protein
MIGEIVVIEMLGGEGNWSGTRGGWGFGSRSRSSSGFNSRGGFLGVGEEQRVVGEVRKDSGFTKHF